MTTRATLLLTRADVRALLDLDACIDAVEAAFRAHADGLTLAPGVLGTHVPGGGFHVKTAGLTRPARRAGGRAFYVAKVNANFPGNPALRGLPTIQGVIALHDAEDGRLLALLDSMEITALRTAAATAVAARFLARENSHVLTVLGCGSQGWSHLRALCRVLPLERAYVWDQDPQVGTACARAMTEELGREVAAVPDYRVVLDGSDVVVTCTPSGNALLVADDIAPGTFVAGVGADSADKQELAPDLLARGTLVVDVLEQCAVIGDLHHALAAGAMSPDDVHAELAEVVSGRRPGRRTADEVTVFDSTGTALEDVAAAALVYERAALHGRGAEVRLGD